MTKDTTSAKQGKKLAQNAEKLSKKRKISSPTDMRLLHPDAGEFALILMAGQLRFYRKALMASIVVAGVSIFAAVQGFNREEVEPKYFAQQRDGTITNVVPLSEPFVDETGMRDWAEQCLIDTLSLSFVKTIQEVNTSLHRCYTDDGRMSVHRWLIEGKGQKDVHLGGTVYIPRDSQLANIITREIQMSASKLAAGKIVSIEPVVDPSTKRNVSRWMVRLPVVITKQEGRRGAGSGNFTVTAILRRVHDVDKPKGVAIDAFQIVSGANHV
ncbi:DotI/IcmL family type IV secretion protein [Aliagarivorans taiwanensis]|uniref:DotI/IcmL family type IV secretion protein n=1 Tax=Aliagarivorans taiwanensis TaxID=561966 RepID=UPI0003FD5E4B|nr:DotI/IcmL family type IV secretion protein [Aliagarivorans taiwanensis]